jgi:ribosome maturation factor RimP
LANPEFIWIGYCSGQYFFWVVFYSLGALISLDRKTLDIVLASVNATIAADGFTCIETLWRSHDRTLQIFIDRDGAAVTVDDCALVSRTLEEKIDLDQWIPGNYNLEVSSPGIERPLRSVSEFERVIGQEVALHLYERIGPAKKGRGRLEQVINVGGESNLLVSTTFGAWQVPVSTILRANLVVDWDSVGLS